MKTRRVCAAIVVAAVIVAFASAGCRRAIPIGPIPITLQVLDGYTLDPADILDIVARKDALQFEMNLCNLPSMSDIRQMVNEVAPSYVASRIKLTRLELDGATFAASDGNFDFVESIDVYYIPKDAEGPADWTLLGSASPEGVSSSSLELVGAPGVNFLRLIEEGEEGADGDCPMVCVEFEGTRPADAITFDLEVRVDAYATFSLR